MGKDKLFQTDLDYYRTFYHVVQQGSISLAATRMSLSQPTVTKGIQRLEDDLQCRLLQRSHSGVTLTPEGEALWSHLQPACELILDAEKELSMFHRLDKGSISIASYESGQQIYILPAMREFVKTFPEIQVNLLTKSPEEMFSLLRAGLIDAALIFSPVTLDDSFESSVIDEYEDALVVGKAYSFLATHEYSIKDLANYPFISYSSEQSLRAFLRKCFETANMIFEPQMEVGSQSLMIQAIIDGIGIGSVPPRAIIKQLANGSMFQLQPKEKMPTRQVLIVKNRNYTLSQPAQIFLQDFLPHFDEFKLF